MIIESKVVPGLSLIKTRQGYTFEKDGEKISCNIAGVDTFIKQFNPQIADELVELEWLKKKKCAECGSVFYTHTDKKQCCSETCQKAYKKTKEYARRERLIHGKQNTHLDNEIDESKRLGMSYGQYKAMQYIKEMEKIKID